MKLNQYEYNELLNTTDCINALCEQKPMMVINTQCGTGKYRFNKRKNIDDVYISRDLLNKAIELDNNLIMAKSLLGNTYLSTADFDIAMEIFTENFKQLEEISDKSMMSISLVFSFNCKVLSSTLFSKF